MIGDKAEMAGGSTANETREGALDGAGRGKFWEFISAAVIAESRTIISLLMSLPTKEVRRSGIMLAMDVILDRAEAMSRSSCEIVRTAGTKTGRVRFGRSG